MLPIIHFVYIFQRLKMITFFIPDWLDKTSNISILSCKLQTPALLPTHVTVGLPQMEGVAYSAICDATFMSRRVIRVPSPTADPGAHKQAQAQPFQIPRRARGRLSGQTAAPA